MKTSSRRAGLGRGSVARHRPQDVDPPLSERHQGLGMLPALAPLTVLEGPRGSG